ncbi:MAG: S8 family serine peptidase [Pirellulaceae bacterium]
MKRKNRKTKPQVTSSTVQLAGKLRLLRLEELEVRRLLSASPERVSRDPQVPEAGPEAESEFDRTSGLNRSVGPLSLSRFAEMSTVEDIHGLPDDLIYDSEGRVAVQVTTFDDPDVEQLLIGLGFASSDDWPDRVYVEGYLPYGSISTMEAWETAGRLQFGFPTGADRGSGSVLSQGDFFHQADRVRAMLPDNIDGTGVKVGVISDSYNALGTAAQDIATGDLPVGGVQVVGQDKPLDGREMPDEGRAMLQIIHDVAPGAELYFASYGTTQLTMADAIRALADAGVDIIVDDVFFKNEPMFQDGVIAQAIDQVVTTQGVAYFSLAGNNGSAVYDSPWRPAVEPESGTVVHDWDPGGEVDIFNRIHMFAGETIDLHLQWDEPFLPADGNQGQLIMVLLDPDTGEELAQSGLEAEPRARLTYTNTSSEERRFDLAIIQPDHSKLTPTRIKFIDFNSFGIGNEYASKTTGTVVPHAAAANARAVGAARMPRDNISRFEVGTGADAVDRNSSQGPHHILFNTNGIRLPTTEVRNVPAFTAASNVNTTFFGVDGRDLDEFPNFAGTSAAAPHAAAIAALVKQKHPEFTPFQIYAALESSAAFAGSYEVKDGFGFLNAYRAVYGAPEPATVGLIDGFENGLGAHWEVFSEIDDGARTQITSEHGPASGGFHLTMDASSKDEYDESEAFNRLILHVDATGAEEVIFSFDHRGFDDDDFEEEMPESFSSRYNLYHAGEGVAFSVDGEQYFRLVAFNEKTISNEYRTYTFNLSQEAARHNLQLSDHVRILFQQYDNGSINRPLETILNLEVLFPPNPRPEDVIIGVIDNSDGWAIDNVKVLSGDPIEIERPLLVLPGIVGSGPAEGQEERWFTTRGIGPEALVVDPIAGVYNDLLKTFDNVGYTPNVNLFVANYDWRMNPGPDDGSVDGTISGLSAASLLDNEFEYGVDYLGYWLQKASDAWFQTHGTRPSSVDIVSHSTGGLVARSYIQSDAYGGVTSAGWNLPRVHDLVMLGVPNRGAAKPWNALQNDFSGDPAYRIVISKIADQAYQRWQAGQTISGPDGDILPGETLTQIEFLKRYVPTIRSLLATYEFYDDGLGAGYQTVNADPNQRNSVLLDLNDGLDLFYALEEMEIVEGNYVGPNGRDPNAFVDRLIGDAVVFFGEDHDTADKVLRRVGPLLGAAQGETTGVAEILPFTDYFGHLPALDEVWYEDLELSAASLAGDGTVPRVSAIGQFLADTDARIKRYAATTETKIDGQPEDENVTGHTGLTSSIFVQRTALNELGISEASYSSQLISSTGLQFRRFESLTAAIKMGIIDLDQLVDEFVLNAQHIADLQTGFGTVGEIVGSVGSALDDVTGNVASDVGSWLADVGKKVADQVDTIATSIVNVANSVITQVNRASEIATRIENALTTGLGIPGVEVVGGLVDLASAPFQALLGPFADGLSAAESEVVWRIVVKNQQSVQLPLDIAQQLGIAGLSIDNDLSADLSINVDMEFGLRPFETNPNERFFIRVTELGGSVRADADDLDLGLNLGPLGASITNGQFLLDADIHARLPNLAVEDRRITGYSLGDLQDIDVAEAWDIDARATIDAYLPISATLGAFQRDGLLTILATNAFDDAPEVSFVGFEDLLGLASMDMDAILLSLGSFEETLALLVDSPLLDFQVPFINANAGDLVQSTLSIVDQLRDVNGQPTVTNIQALVVELTSLLGLDPGAIGIDFDLASKELSLDVDISQSFATQFIGFSPNLGFGPVSLASNGQFSVEAGLDTSFHFVLDVDPVAAAVEASTPAPSDGVFPGTADFEIAVGTNEPVSVQLTSSGVTTLAQLVAKLQSALDAVGLADFIVASETNGVLKLTTSAAASSVLAFSANPSNAAVTHLGFPANRLAIDSVAAHAYVEDVDLQAHFDLGGQVSGSVSVGPVGLDGQVVSSGLMRVGLDLAGGQRLPVDELLSRVFADPFDLVNPQLSGSLELDVRELQTRGGFAIGLPDPTGLLPEDVQIEITIPDLGSPDFLENITVQYNDTLLGDLLSLRDFTFDDLLSVLESLARSLVDMAKQELLGVKIPIIGASAGDLLDLGSDILALVAELRTESGQAMLLETLQQRIAEAFDQLGIPIGDLSLDVLGRDIVLELDWQQAASRQFDLDIDLGAFGPDAGALLSVGSDDQIDVAVGAEFNLVLGIETAIGAVPRPYLRGDSGLAITAEVLGTGLDFDITALGIVPLFIRNGSVILDADGVDANADGFSDGEPARFSIDLPGGAGTRHYLVGAGGLQAPPIQVQLDAGVDLLLPLFFPDESTPFDDGNSQTTNEFRVTVPDLAEVLAGNTSNVEISNPPDFAAVAGNIDLRDALRLLLSGIQRVFPGIARTVDGVLERPLPLIGSSLAELSSFDFVGGFLPSLENGLELAFDSVVAPQFTDIRDVLNNALASLLQQPVTFASTAQEVVYQIHLGDQISETIPIKADLGLPALGLDVDADVNVDFTWSLNLGLGVSLAEGFFLEIQDGTGQANDEIHVGLNVGLANATALATLGFLQVEVTDQGTHLGGELSVNLAPSSDGTRIGFQELVASSSLSELVDVNLSGGAEARFGARLSSTFATGMLPSLLADFQAAWSLGNDTPTSAGFHNIRMDLGQLFNGFSGPIFDVVETVLDPIKPLLEVLDTRIPVLSDFSIIRSVLDSNRDGRVTVLEAAEFVGVADTGFFESLAFVAGLTDRIGGVIAAAENASGSLLIPLPDFDLTGQALNLANGLNGFVITPPTFDIDQAIDTISDNATRDAAADFVDYSSTSSGPTVFSIPILDEPASVFGLLIGRDVPLFSLDFAPLFAEFGIRQFVPIIGPLGATVAGRIAAKADFAFGYDTRGIRDFAASGFQPSQIGTLLNGIFLYDRVDSKGRPSITGNDIDEVQLIAGIDVSGTVNLGIVSGDAGGFIEGIVGFDLYDGDGDGRTRFSEIVSCPFEPHGAIDAGLFAQISIGYRWFKVRKRFELARVNLIDVNGSCDPSETNSLATIENGTLKLNVGRDLDTNASPPIFASDETIRVTLEEDGSIYRVWSRNRYQDIDGHLVQRIEALAGGGNDRIIVDSEITVPTFLDGGDGNDVLVGGSGPNEIHGGKGNDELSGGPLNDILNGGEGNDYIYGGAGNDSIDAGDGDDEVNAGEGNDLVLGGDGNDRIVGEAGNDQLFGGTGDDEIDGGAGNDLLEGSLGNDSLAGGAGQDTLRGGSGADTLVGGGGNDTLWGHGDLFFPDDHAADRLRGDSDPADRGNELPADSRDTLPGDDLLYGEGGNDQLFGDGGNDQLFGAIGSDRLDGGPGNDQLDGGSEDDALFGGAGDDVLFGRTGDDRLDGGAGNDQLYGDQGADLLLGGSGNDEIFGHSLDGTGDDDAPDVAFGGTGDDQVFGQGGADELHGGPGSDFVIGEAGNDLIFGDSGDDLLRGGDDDDTMHGGLGNDSILGQAGDDVLYGELDNDEIQGGLGADVAFGGAGVDYVYGHLKNRIGDDDESDWLYGDFGFGHPFSQAAVGVGDRDLLFGQGGDDHLFGELGRDDLFGGSGDDQLDGGEDADLIHGQDGNDLAHGGDGDDRILGDAGDDVLHGDTGDDRIDGGDGLDQIFGGDGDDTLRGQEDGDLLSGDAGRDLLEGGPGEDTLMGGPGTTSCWQVRVS